MLPTAGSSTAAPVSTLRRAISRKYRRRARRTAAARSFVFSGVVFGPGAGEIAACGAVTAVVMTLLMGGGPDIVRAPWPPEPPLFPLRAQEALQGRAGGGVAGGDASQVLGERGQPLVHADLPAADHHSP